MKDPAQRDPRSIVTPDAFEVSTALLGTPLATPGRRLLAMAIDGVVIGVLTAVTRSFALVLGVVAAVLLMRAGFKRTQVRGSVFGRAMRVSVGCLGLFVGLITMAVWASLGIGVGGGGAEDAPETRARFASAAGRVLSELAEAGVVTTYEGVVTLEEAERVTLDLIELGEEMGLREDEIRSFLVAAVPEEAPWASGADALFARLLPEEAAAASATAETDARSEIAELSVVDALEAYAAVLAESGDDPVVAERRALLEARLAGLVAADTLRALQGEITRLERRARQQQDVLDELVEEVADAESGGPFGWLMTVVDELGFGFGWASLYLTVFLSWWNGQTVGKRLMGIRVARLDGDPTT